MSVYVASRCDVGPNFLCLPVFTISYAHGSALLHPRMIWKVFMVVRASFGVSDWFVARRRARSSALEAVLFGLVLLALGCGGGAQQPSPQPLPVSISVTPSTANLLQGASQSFTATVTNATNTAVTWAVQESG